MVKKYIINLQLHFIKSLYKDFKYSIEKVLTMLTSIVVLASIALFLLEFVFQINTKNQAIFTQLYLLSFIYFCIEVCLKFCFSTHKIHHLKSNILNMVVFIPFIPQNLLPFFQVINIKFLLLILILTHFKEVLNTIAKLKLKPATLFLYGFILSIFIGSMILSLPISNKQNQAISYIDALFTATSAICVTGLNVTEISQTFSTFGLSIILLLCQIGGLGIMSFAILLSLFLKRKLSQHSSLEFQHNYATYNLKETFSSIKFIFQFTLLFEALGAMILFYLFKDIHENWTIRLFYAIFHSVSAFCNAGFSLFTNSLEHLHNQTGILICISGLIIAGGLGFPVLFNIYQTKRQNKPFHFLKLQTKIALIVTSILLVVGTCFIWLGEYSHALKDMPFQTQILNSFFQSTSARTAGFNTIDLNSFQTSTIIIMLILMIIGASPGSTGGGIKTTNFGILMLSFWQTIKGAPRIEAGGRTIDYESILKTLSILILYLIGIFSTFYLLLLVENLPSLALLFETVSAFGTVGFSLGITSQLSFWGKVIIMIAMFIGRMGPLTVAFALSKTKRKLNYSYPKEELSII